MGPKSRSLILQVVIFVITSLGVSPELLAAAVPALADNWVKFNPGHYALSGYIVNAGNKSGAWTRVKADLDLTLANANVRGIMFFIQWAAVEDTTAGSYDWSLIDQIRAYLLKNYPTKHLVIGIGAANFWGTSATNVVPSYILNDSTYGSGADGTHSGYVKLGNYGCTIAWWRSPIVARLKALHRALAAHSSPYGAGTTYDTDPFVEAITFEESAIDFASPPSDLGSGSSALATLIAAWEQINANMVAAFPHTSIIDQDNYWAFGGPQDAIGVVNANSNARVAQSSPDIQPKMQWGPLAYIGQTAGSTSQIGKVPFMAQVQYPDYPLWSSLSQIFDVAASTLHASHIFWDVRSDGLGAWSNVIALINGNPIPAANQGCPRLYGTCNRK
jgi:hypothetical protein